MDESTSGRMPNENIWSVEDSKMFDVLLDETVTTSEDLDEIWPTKAVRTPGVFDEQLYQEWLGTEPCTYVIFVLSLYILVALCVYHYRYNSDCFRIQWNRERMNSAVNILTILACFTSLLDVFFGIETIWGRSSTIRCVYLKPIKLILSILTYSWVFLAFWIRQWAFYGSTATMHLTSPIFRCISNVFGPVMILGAIGNLVLFLVTSQPVSAPPNGCLFHYRHAWEESKFYILAVSSSFAHIMLLILLLHPLVKSRQNRIAQSVKNDVTFRLMRRVSASTAVALVAYLTTLFLIVFVRRDVDELSTFSFDVCLTLMNICLLFSFGDWRKRFFPFLPLSESEKPRAKKAGKLHHAV